MKKYNVNIDRTKPSSEEILSGRNFDELMKQYNAASAGVVKKPFWKSGWFIGSAVTVIVAVSAIFIFTDNIPADNSQNKAPLAQAPASNNIDSSTIQPLSQTPVTTTPSKRIIAQPIPGLNVKNFAYKFNSVKGSTFTHTSGTKVTFSPNSFVDAAGNPVNGNVEIQYREFRDQVDFFLSGIPMQYDSAGHVYQFESAGMMEISGMINGQPVFLKKDKKVKVEFASKDASTRYNLYQFDGGAGNWNYLGKDKVEKKADTTRIINTPSFEEHVYAMPVEPIKPVQADKRKNRFTVAIDPVEFPEMKQYTDMIFQVDESNQRFDKSWYTVTWETIKLSRADGVNKYKIALTKGQEKVMLDVYPVLADKNYSDAMVVYEKEFAEYTKKLAEYNARADWKKQQVIYGTKPLTPEQIANHAKTAEIYRTFEVAGFGIYNLDCPAAFPKGADITLELKVGDGSSASDFRNIFLADRKKKAIYNYYNLKPFTGFKFNPNSSNVVWAVKEGKLFYADNDQFLKLPANGKGSLELQAVNREFKTPAEMKAFFKIQPGS